jgi:hypothetical protein
MGFVWIANSLSFFRENARIATRKRIALPV